MLLKNFPEFESTTSKYSNFLYPVFFFFDVFDIFVNPRSYVQKDALHPIYQITFTSKKKKKLLQPSKFDKFAEGIELHFQLTKLFQDHIQMIQQHYLFFFLL